MPDLLSLDRLGLDLQLYVCLEKRILSFLLPPLPSHVLPELPYQEVQLWYMWKHNIAIPTIFSFSLSIDKGIANVIYSHEDK